MHRILGGPGIPQWEAPCCRWFRAARMVLARERTPCPDTSGPPRPARTQRPPQARKEAGGPFEECASVPPPNAAAYAPEPPAAEEHRVTDSCLFPKKHKG